MDSQKALAVFTALDNGRKLPWKGEADLRQDWVQHLSAATGVRINVEHNKLDASAGHVIIEFKALGYFKGSKRSASFIEATEQRLKPYILRTAQATGIPKEDFIGIAIDGNHICFAQMTDKGLETQHLLPFSPYSVGLVLQAILTDTRRAIAADHLLADFGHGAPAARTLMQALSDALATELKAKGNSKIKMLFAEWRTLFGQVADMSDSQASAISSGLGFNWTGNKPDAMSGQLFVVHTYNSLLIKLLAAEIVSAHGLTAIKQPAQAMSAEPSDSRLLDLLLQDIEKGVIFSQAGIQGFVEEAIFGWYIDAGRDPAYQAQVIPALRGILAALSLYRTDRLSHTRDVLRDLYQGLVPGKLRQSLGEFYTPDWLVETTVDKAAPSGTWLLKRVLDPTCGSGAFLLEILRRKKLEAAAQGWDADKTLKNLCSTVWGFDLNPLAVQTARVNFLMEIAGLMQSAGSSHIEIPVLLADAIYSPARSPKAGEDIVEYRIGSDVARLVIQLPATLAFDRIRLDRIFAHMGDAVDNNTDYAPMQKAMVAAGLVSAAEIKEWNKPLKATYEQVLALHRQNWNGIWFRIVRNYFWSATAGEFDVVVGNPPWVRWSKLPTAYRDRVKPTCESYDIFSSNKRHGGNELDISAMITFTVADKWLKQGGALSFVITGTLFKNPSSEGFRRLILPASTKGPLYLAPAGVDDLKALKPFADASNHTTIVTLTKTNKPAAYPVPYRVWSAKAGQIRAIDPAADLSAVLSRVSIAPMEATPVGGPGSPWAVLKAGRFAQLEHLAGTCDWVAGRKGITTDLNGVYFVPATAARQKGMVMIESRPEAGRKDIGPARNALVENDLLYPLIKGAGDFEPCYLRLANPAQGQDYYTFVPNRGISDSDYAAAQAAVDSLPSTKAWFRHYSALLDARSTYKRQMVGAPNFAVYNVGPYTFQQWKVIWPEMSTKFFAAVAGSAAVPSAGQRPYVPDHKVYFAAFDDKETAHFLCGLLNTDMVREWIESHNVSIQVGDIFKHLSLPAYDPNDAAHVALAALVEKAHQEHNPVLRAKLVKQVCVDGDAVLTAWIAAGCP